MNSESDPTIGEKYAAVRALRDEFFSFHVNTKVQLQVSQLQFFQSLAGITLAFVAVVVGIGRFEPNIYFLCSGVLSMLLIIYIATHTRETIDQWDAGLEDTENELKDQESELLKQLRGGEVGNLLQVQETNTLVVEKAPLSYAGEISMFLFSSSVLFCAVAVFYALGYSVTTSPDLTYIFVICSSFLISFRNWNLVFTKWLSARFEARLW